MKKSQNRHRYVEQDPQAHLEVAEAKVFAHWIDLLNQAEIPYVVSGAFAIQAYTGILRDTKDLDVFLRPIDLKRALVALREGGYDTEIRNRSWLAKAHAPPYFMDLIFAMSNNRFPIDETWFENSRRITFMGVQTPLIAVEELIASKAYIIKTYRFDGADIAHLIRAVRGNLDWERLLVHMEQDPELLLWHLLFFSYVYPGHDEYLPRELMGRLFDAVKERWTRPADPRAFRGSMLDPEAFEIDCREWGYQDRRRTEPLVDSQGDPL